MNKLFYYVTLFLVSTIAVGQTDTTKVALVSYWSVGDSYNFKVVKTSQQWIEDKLTKDEKREYIANFSVIDSTENSYTIKWRYENDLTNLYKIPVELLIRFSKYKVTEIKYKTSAVGDFIEVLNWQEVGETMRTLFDDIVEVLGEKDIQKKEAIKNAMQPYKQVYSSKEGIEQLLFIDLQYFHFLLGREYDVTAPLSYDEEFPNMFGGKPIKAKTELKFALVDSNESFCIVKQEKHLDPDDTKLMIREVFKANESWKERFR